MAAAARVDLFLSFHGSERLSGGFTTRELAREVVREVRLGAKPRFICVKPAVFLDEQVLKSEVRAIFEAIINTRGGGVALFLVTREYFQRAWCVAEMRSVMDVRRGDKHNIKVRLICLEENVDAVLKDGVAARVMPDLTGPAGFSVLPAASGEGGKEDMAKRIADVVWAAWEGGGREGGVVEMPSILGGSRAESLRFLKMKFSECDLPGMREVFGIEYPGPRHVLDVLRVAQKRKLVHENNVTKLYEVIECNCCYTGKDPVEESKYVAAYERKWIANNKSDNTRDALQRKLEAFYNQAKVDIEEAVVEERSVLNLKERSSLYRVASSLASLGKIHEWDVLQALQDMVRKAADRLMSYGVSKAVINFLTDPQVIRHVVRDPNLLEELDRRKPRHIVLQSPRHRLLNHQIHRIFGLVPQRVRSEMVDLVCHMDLAIDLYNDQQRRHGIERLGMPSALLQIEPDTQWGLKHGEEEVHACIEFQEVLPSGLIRSLMAQLRNSLCGKHMRSAQSSSKAALLFVVLPNQKTGRVAVTYNNEQRRLVLTVRSLHPMRLVQDCLKSCEDALDGFLRQDGIVAKQFLLVDCRKDRFGCGGSACVEFQLSSSWVRGTSTGQLPGLTGACANTELCDEQWALSELVSEPPTGCSSSIIQGMSCSTLSERNSFTSIDHFLSKLRPPFRTFTNVEDLHCSFEDLLSGSKQATIEIDCKMHRLGTYSGHTAAGTDMRVGRPLSRMEGGVSCVYENVLTPLQVDTPSFSHDVFLSFAELDRESVARPLSEILSAAGVGCFLRSKDRNVFGGVSADEISAEMRGRKLVVFVLSSEFVSLERPMFELLEFMRMREKALEEESLGMVCLPLFYRLTVENCTDQVLLILCATPASFQIAKAKGGQHRRRWRR